jgi:transposase
LLFAQGIRIDNTIPKTLALEKLVTGDGRPLRPRLSAEIDREMKRFAMVQEQIDEIEKERDTAPTTCKETEKKRQLLLQLKSIDPTNAALLSP